ncbi:MAG: PAS domain S-box protein, partial [Myxococcales bacterium]|nr:PAS domain S-box protein [Myxococcales bacterium]
TAVAPKLIVGIGASAGGLEPLERFFAAMPSDTGMAFVVLQHLSPDFESRMDELLGRQTRMPILKVTDGIQVEPDRIYLIPPRKEMIVAGGRLLLTDKDDTRGFSLPIDHFFRSLAHDAGRRAVAIVLSGAGSDGSRGIREVHDAGGLVLCQVPEVARFQGMPLSAKQTGVVDAFLPADEMPGAIVRYLNDPARSWDQPDADTLPTGSSMEEILRLLRAEYGIDFAHYKPTTVTRRIERRVSLSNQLDIEAYARLVASDPEELNALYRDLLIGVTRFFRDVEAFQQLEMHVIPAILSATPPNEEVRVWVAGCATGEEAYSIAILFHEQLEVARRPLNLKIFATDVHRHSLDVASAGLYDEDALSDVTGARRDRYFVRDDHRYRVSKDLRQLIVFARHNLLTDAPFTRLDLISCRNLLIYFQPLAQKKALSLFHFGMKTGSTLLLGPSETPGEVADEFDTIDGHWRIYRKRRDARLPDIRLPIPAPGGPGRPLFPSGRTVPGPHVLGIYDQLLAKVMPASVLIDEQYQLVHSFGGAEQLLHVRPGRPSNNVLDMVEESLKPALLGALQHAHKERKPVRLSGVPVRTPEGNKDYRLTVDPLGASQNAIPHFLVSFEAKGPLEAPAEQPTSLDAPAVSRDYVRALENELRFTKESLQATIEELETANEELQATNEELVASNEELQSTNEELHSVNEELYTVNVEHQRKITQLGELTDDLDGLLHGIDVGVLFLDEALCIRKYTAQAAHVFRLLPQDVGRRFDSFAPTIQHPGLENDVQQVLKTNQPIQREVTSRDGIIYLLRILPHRSRTAKTGVVVLLVDVSELKRSEASVRRLSAIVESSGDAIFSKDAYGKIAGWNRGAESLYGWSADEVMGRDALFMVATERRAEAAAKLRQAEHGEVLQPYETVHLRKDGTPVDVSIGHAPIYDEHDAIAGVSSISRDVTQKKRDEAEVQRALRMRDQFMAMLSHELRNPLAALLNASALLEKSGNGNGNAERTHRALQTIGRQCRHMARLLDDLLDVSRMRQDEIELRRTNLDLRTTVEAALERVRPMADVAEVAISSELAPDPVEVFGDADRLQQIEVNLLTNAIKYTPAGRRIRLSVAREGAEAVLRVADDGTGIATHMLERIFEPFVRAVDEENGKRTGGMGLGLALVRSFVRAHGGDVRAYSAGLGQGSEFVVRLPLAKTAARPAQVDATQVGGVGESIVLVEDQEDNRMLLSDILADAGYVVLPAADGRQALDLIEKQRPAVAVVDIGLPEISGYDVAREVRMRLQRSDMFLVALTGYGQQQDREAVLKAGFDQHLVKPVDITTLLDVLRTRKSLRGSAQWAALSSSQATV